MRKSLNFIKFTMVSAAATALFLVSVSCDPSKKKVVDTFDEAAAKLAIETENQFFTDAFNRGDSKTAAETYAIDAKFMPSNGKSVSGRKAIQTAIAEYIKAGAPRLALRPIEVWGDKNMITVEEEWVMTDKDGKEIDRGKAMEIWKIEDGKWKLFRDCFNSDLPCMPMPAAPVAAPSK
jgi:uncharacterized protein (TIGR02246 family)